MTILKTLSLMVVPNVRLSLDGVVEGGVSKCFRNSKNSVISCQLASYTNGDSKRGLVIIGRILKKLDQENRGDPEEDRKTGIHVSRYLARPN